MQVFTLGRGIKDERIRDMLAESSGPVNFQIFLGLFGDKLSGEMNHNQ